MIGKAPDQILRAGAIGTLINASTYGRTIPLIYGTVRSPVLAIWANNIRIGPSGKKKKSKLKGINTYNENIDFLLGHNPLLQPLQLWDNANNFYPLQFKKLTVTLSSSPAWGEVVIADALFYAVVAVTVTENYNATFSDFGVGGAFSQMGTFEVPCWPAVFNGPNPVASAAYANFPYAYTWIPGSGATVKFPFFGTGDAKVVNIYYAAQSPNAKAYAAANIPDDATTPLAALALTWEPQLGDGPEYSGYSGEQIVYPFFGGAGSAAIDLGVTGAIPNINIEMQASFPVYADPSLASAGGDADFADMIEDIFHSGPAQAGIDGALGLTAVQHGLNCNDFPGIVQRKQFFNATTLPAAIPFDNAVTKGDFIVVAIREDGAGGAPSGISDSLGNSWTSLLAANPSSGVYTYAWYTQVAATGNMTITVAGVSGANIELQMMDVAGFDTLENAVTAGATSGVAAISISSTTPRTFPGLVVAWFDTEGNESLTTNPRWQQVMNNQPTVTGYSEQRRVFGPAEVSTSHQLAPSTPWAAFAVAFKNTITPQYPISLGDILEKPTLDNARAGARAGGLWGSINMNSARQAADILKDLYASMNAAPVWSGFKLKSIAWSEVSQAGNGAIFQSPASAGPVAFLGPADFVGEGEGLSVARKAEWDAPPILSMQHGYRDNNYNQVVTTEPNAPGLVLFGAKKADPLKRDEIQDPAIARTLLGIASRDQVYLRNTYKAKVKANHNLLEPMDLVWLYDPQLPLGAPSPLPFYRQVGTGATNGSGGATATFPLPVLPGSTIIAVVSAQPPNAGSGASGVTVTDSVGTTEVTDAAQGPAGTNQTFIKLSRLVPIIVSSTTYSVTATPSGGSGTFSTNLQIYELAGTWTLDTALAVSAATGPSNPAILLGTTGYESVFAAGVMFNQVATTITVRGIGPAVSGNNFVQSSGLFKGPASPPRPVRSFFTISKDITSLDAFLFGWGLALAIAAYIPPVGFVPTGGNTSNSPTNSAYRITSVQEDKDRNLDMEFEDFLYGVHAPQQPTTVTPTAPYRPTYGATGGNVNAPIIFEAVPRLGQSNNQEELWIVLSSANPNYGGALVYISTDGGTSYETQQAWVAKGNGTTGYTVGDWPAHADPDTVNNLAVNLAESLGELADYSVGQEDAFQSICWLDGGNVTIPYELMSYATANLTSANHYTLEATGTGNHLRRAVFAAPAAGAGVDHPNNTRFAFLGSPTAVNAPGIVRILVDPAWIGTTIKLKFPSFNTLGSGTQSLTGLTVYSFTITGLPGGVNPFGIPPNLVTVN